MPPRKISVQRREPSLREQLESEVHLTIGSPPNREPPSKEALQWVWDRRADHLLATAADDAERNRLRARAALLGLQS